MNWKELTRPRTALSVLIASLCTVHLLKPDAGRDGKESDATNFGNVISALSGSSKVLDYDKYERVFQEMYGSNYEKVESALRTVHEYAQSKEEHKEHDDAEKISKALRDLRDYSPGEMMNQLMRMFHLEAKTTQREPLPFETGGPGGVSIPGGVGGRS